MTKLAAVVSGYNLAVKGAAMQPICQYRCPGWLLTDWNKFNRNPNDSTKCCSERSGRKLEAPWPYSFVGRDGSPQELLQMVPEFGVPDKAMLKIHLVCRKELTPKLCMPPACSWAIAKECPPLHCFFLNYFTGGFECHYCECVYKYWKNNVC